MNDKDTPFLILGIVALYIFYKISLASDQVQLTKIAQTNAAENNPWLTVPGAVSQGLVGIGSLLNGFNNLFTSNDIVGDDVTSDF